MENVAIVGFGNQSTSSTKIQTSLHELKLLVETAGGRTVLTFTQRREKAEPSTLIGKGKLEEISQQVKKEKMCCGHFRCRSNPGPTKKPAGENKNKDP